MKKDLHSLIVILEILKVLRQFDRPELLAEVGTVFTVLASSVVRIVYG